MTNLDNVKFVFNEYTGIHNGFFCSIPDNEANEIIAKITKWLEQ